MAYTNNSASEITDIKTLVNNEAARRKYNGAVNARVTANFNKGDKISADNYNNLIAPLRVINSTSSGMPSTVGQGVVINIGATNQFYRAKYIVQTMAGYSMTATSLATTGCNAACSGLCYTGCAGTCKGSCSGSCSGNCGNNCTGSCSGVCSGSCDDGCTDGFMGYCAQYGDAF